MSFTIQAMRYLFTASSICPPQVQRVPPEVDLPIPDLTCYLNPEKLPVAKKLGG